MEPLSINMKKSKSTKRFDVYEAEKSDAHITSVYINKAASCPEEITLVVFDKK
jgi:hypothetical protein